MSKFNYAKLLGKIKEQGFTQAKLADAIGINRGTLSAKLNGQYSFSVKEIDSICILIERICPTIGLTSTILTPLNSLGILMKRYIIQ